MTYNLKKKSFLFTGIIFTLISVINGIIVSISGSGDSVELIKSFFWNPFSIFGYIILSIGLILHLIEIEKRKDVQKIKSQKKQYNSLRDFVKDKTNDEP